MKANITKPEFVSKFRNFPRGALSLFSGFKFNNRYFSGNFNKVAESLYEKHPDSKGCSLVKVTMVLFSSQFSHDYFSRDSIRLHSEIQRIFMVRLKQLPVGFEVFYDKKHRALRSSFYFINYDHMNEESFLKGPISNDAFGEIVNAVKSRVGNAPSFGWTKVHNQLDDEVLLKATSKQRETLVELDSQVYELANQIADPEVRVAISRAFKGLPLKKALKLQNTLNRLLELNDDTSIEQLELPKKHGKTSRHADYSEEVSDEDLLN
ncbi:TPA: hypothetical protein I7730_14430 [Vibrio vulnificus]|uniref:Uncharacterized protein n=1 Tax=Vibrio vulnificus TaxID=672 RepID=A0A8H9TFP0_VIBVL|nr:hypothetical protein [Vibrio vulnificus]HAS8540984.1 hypothetical protein [Vibrio vulnificus]